MKYLEESLFCFLETLGFLETRILIFFICSTIQCITDAMCYSDFVYCPVLDDMCYVMGS